LSKPHDVFRACQRRSARIQQLDCLVAFAETQFDVREPDDVLGAISVVIAQVFEPVAGFYKII
jgi:hypothetical protein